MSDPVLIRYAGTSHWFTALVTQTWKRDDAEMRLGPVMSSSSGPKDYLRNDIWKVFQVNPQIETITMLVLNRTPFLVMRAGLTYFDCSEREIELKRPAASKSSSPPLEATA